MPGEYQVKVKVKINGQKMNKTLNFNIDACDFNRNILVEFP